MSADLLLKASDCPGILDGWCGPALSGDITPIVLTTGATVDGYREAWWPTLFRAGTVPVEWIRLDLARDEAADRAARWAAPLLFPGEPPFVAACIMPGRRAFGNPALTLGMMTCTTQDGERWRALDDVAPTLRDLDPADPRTLPGGARWVDRVALVLACRHVGSQR